MSSDVTYRAASSFPEGLLELLGGPYTMRILEATLAEPRTAGDLSDELDAPRTTVYRRIRSLEEHGLVRTAGELDPDGAHRITVESSLDGLSVTCDEGVYALTIRLRGNAPDDWQRVWRRIRDSVDG